MPRDSGVQSEIAGLSLWSCPTPYRTTNTLRGRLRGHRLQTARRTELDDHARAKDRERTARGVWREADKQWRQAQFH